MTTLGGNIRAIEVDGTFDDCQRLVKQALTDTKLVAQKNLTTANSINVGRLLPQITYYAWATAQLQKQYHDKSTSPVIVVPSGNFGNVTAAMYAKLMGVSIRKLIAATNANDVVPEYVRTGTFSPRASVQTYSNAMDVGNPSNIARLQALFNFDITAMHKEIETCSISDKKTLAEIKLTYDRTGYILDPHTAVGVAAARTQLQKETQPIIVASTAHPAKFPDVVEKAVGIKVPLPEALKHALQKKKQSVKISATFEELRAILQMN